MALTAKIVGGKVQHSLGGRIEVGNSPGGVESANAVGDGVQNQMLSILKPGKIALCLQLAGHVGRDSGNPVNRSRFVSKRKFHREILVRTIIVRCDLFTLKRFARLQDGLIVDAEFLCQFLGKDVEIRFSKTLHSSHVKQLFKLSVDEQIPKVQVLGVNHRRGVVKKIMGEHQIPGIDRNRVGSLHGSTSPFAGSGSFKATWTDRVIRSCHTHRYTESTRIRARTKRTSPIRSHFVTTESTGTGLIHPK